MLILARLTFRRKSKVFEERAWGDMQTCKKGYRGGKVCIPTKRGNTQQHPNIPNIPNIPSQRNFEIFGFLKTCGKCRAERSRRFKGVLAGANVIKG